MGVVTVPTPTATPRRHAPSPALLATAALLGITAVWGSTFFMLKDVVTRIPVPDFLAVRFVVAAVALWLLRPRALVGLGAASWRKGVGLGVVYGVAQVLQTAGLQHTSASVSGFITGMYVVFTPLFAAVLLRARVGRAVWVAVALATAGMGTLSLQGFALGSGEALTLASAALYAVHILGLGLWSTPREAYALSVVQMITIGGVCAAAAAPGGIALPANAADWTALLYMALVAGALSLVAQTWAQAHLPATRAAIIMTMEPVWAALFAVLFGGEVLGWRVVVGGALVLTGMYLSELGPRRAPAPPPAPAAGPLSAGPPAAAPEADRSAAPPPPDPG